MACSTPPSQRLTYKVLVISSYAGAENELRSGLCQSSLPSSIDSAYSPCAPVVTNTRSSTTAGGEVTSASSFHFSSSRLTLSAVSSRSLGLKNQFCGPLPYDTQRSGTGA